VEATLSVHRFRARAIRIMAFWTAIFLSSTCEHSPLEPPGPDSHADLPLPPNPFAAGPGDTTVTLVGAGDIVRCDSQEDEATANLLDTIPGIVFTAGDNAYADASQYPDFATCYEASWGRHKARTRPAHGHMENWQPGSANYYNYFGAAAGDPAKGYYSYDVGAWHVVVLNSKSTTGLIAGSAQNLWLINDLQNHTQQCLMAIWHHPLFSSAGSQPVNPAIQATWDVLYGAG
jgi:hypothetical protein